MQSRKRANTPPLNWSESTKPEPSLAKKLRSSTFTLPDMESFQKPFEVAQLRLERLGPRDVHQIIGTAAFPQDHRPHDHRGQARALDFRRMGAAHGGVDRGLEGLGAVDL